MTRDELRAILATAVHEGIIEVIRPNKRNPNQYWYFPNKVKYEKKEEKKK